MARTNTFPVTYRPKTHEGAPAARISLAQELRRTVMACLLWEDTFYESGVAVGDRIKDLVARLTAGQPNNPVGVAVINTLAIEARDKMHLRHVPLLLARELVRHGHRIDGLLPAIIQRPDELMEFMSLYWADGKCPVDHSVIRGLDRAIRKFDAYQFAKYDRRTDKIKMRDIFRIVRPKPRNDVESTLFKAVVAGALPAPDTWEAAFGADGEKKTDEEKRAVWLRLLAAQRLGGLALLRNLSGMLKVGVHEIQLRGAIEGMRTDRILPFRFIAAARAVPRLEPSLEIAMLRCLEGQEMLSGTTVLLVDVSGSMNDPLSKKSDMRRLDAAAGLAILLAGVSGSGLRVFTFSNNLIEVPPRRGFALRDVIDGSQPHSVTAFYRAIGKLVGNQVSADRLIVITDEQAHAGPGGATGVETAFTKRYVVNVGSYKNGIGYGAWTHIDGFSESVIDYIRESERAEG